MLSKMHSLPATEKNVFAIRSILHFAVAVCLMTSGCFCDLHRDSRNIKRPESDTRGNAQSKGVVDSKKGVIDIENDLSRQTGDRIEVLTHIENDRDREAIDAAINWLRTRTDEPLDVVIKLRREGGTCSVLVTFVFRNDDGEPFHVPGGHCMLTVSESGEVVDVMKGA